MSDITRLYNGTGTDNTGRMLQDIWAFNAHDLEYVHDYIQWLFPLQEASRFNPDAPLLTAEDIQAFKSDKMLQQNMQHSFELLLGFYGFEKTADGIIKAENFANCADNWITPNNHNFLRITRILKCMTLVGLETESQEFFKSLTQVFNDYANIIGRRTLMFWEQAAQPEGTLQAKPAPQIRPYKP